jgi:hypothetical protein
MYHAERAHFAFEYYNYAIVEKYIFYREKRKEKRGSCLPSEIKINTVKIQSGKIYDVCQMDFKGNFCNKIQSSFPHTQGTQFRLDR